jgi:two-component system cell cycle response regulator
MKQRVLVVDDDPRLVRVVAMYLSIEGYDVVTASDADSGLAEVDKQCPDLIILDIMMGGLDGIDVCTRIRSNPRTAEIPVIMFSAISSGHDVERARLAGANHLITKPFNLVGLGTVVSSFFADIQIRVAEDCRRDPRQHRSLLPTNL